MRGQRESNEKRSTRPQRSREDPIENSARKIEARHKKRVANQKKRKGGKGHQRERKGPIGLEPLASQCIDHGIDTLNEHVPNELNQGTTSSRPIDGKLNHI